MIIYIGIVVCVILIFYSLQTKIVFFPKYVYKKAIRGDYKNVIIKLYIRPFTLYNQYRKSNKMRFSSAVVICITNMYGKGNFKQAVSYLDEKFIYKIGETVYPTEPFDLSNEICESGIHAFNTFDEAVKYNF